MTETEARANGPPFFVFTAGIPLDTLRPALAYQQNGRLRMLEKCTKKQGRFVLFSMK